METLYCTIWSMRDTAQIRNYRAFIIIMATGIVRSAICCILTESDPTQDSCGERAKRSREEIYKFLQAVNEDRCHVKMGTPNMGTPGPHFHMKSGTPVPIFIIFWGPQGPHIGMRLGTLP